MARRPATKKKILIAAAAVVLVLVILVAITPMLISAGLGHGMIRSAIEDQLAPGSRADFQQLSVSWRGPQELRGLRIVDPRGEEVADVNMQISPSLWSLLFGTVAVFEANISGTVRGEIYDDGSTSFEEVIEPGPPRPERPERERARPMQGVPNALVHVDGLDVIMTQVSRETGERQMMTLRDLRGDLTYARAGDDPSEVSIQLTGQTRADDREGDVRVTGYARNLFDRDGYFTPSGAPMGLELALTTLPVLGMDIPTELTRLAMVIGSENMAELISMDVEAEAVIQDEAPSRFRGEISVSFPFTPEGRLDMSVDRVAGTMRGERVPASLIQPLLRDTPIVLRRDVGATIDLDAQLAPAEDGLATIRAVGPRAELDLAARFDEETEYWIGERLVLRTAEAHPELVRGFTQLAIDRPANVEIEMTSFAFPPADPATGTRPLGLYGGTGVLRVNEPVELLFQPGEDPNAEVRTVLLEEGEIEFESSALGEYLDLNGRLIVEGAEVRLTERITNLFDEAGAMDVFNANIVGELVVEGLPAQTLAQWMPEQEAMIDELLGQQVSATLTTTMAENGLQATLIARGDAIETNLVALRRPDALEINQTWAEFTLTPRLMEMLQEGQEEPVILIEPTLARFELEPIILPGREPREYRLDERDVRGRMLMEDLTVDQVPGFAEPVSMHDFDAMLHIALARDPFADEPVDPDEPLFAQYALEGGAILRRVENGATRANVAYNIAGRPGAEQMELSGSLSLSQIDVPSVELVLGREPGIFELWTGDQGTIRADFSAVDQRYEATLVSEMPRLQGTFAATYADELLALNTDAASLSLGAEALQNLMAAEDPAAPQMRVERDVPLTLSLDSRMPLGFLTNEPFDPTLLDITAEMRGGPLVMLIEDERTTLDNALIALTTEAFSDAVTFNIVIEGDVREDAAEARTGDVNVRASLREPVLPGEPMRWDAGRIDLDAALNHAPTALADAFLGMRGYLTATVGAHVGGTITARDLSRTAVEGGTLTADLTSPHGWLRGSGIGQNGALIISEDRTIDAELEITPLLRDAVLSRLNPLLGEVLLAEQPLRVTFAPAALPLDGDITKLSGEIRMTLGDVQLDQRSPLFAILAMADVGERGLAAHIEPIEITISEGLITYDRFIVQIDRFEMPYSGQINLATGQVRLRTALPLGALRIRELERLAPEAGDLEVPLVTTGTLGEPLTMEVDPDFDIAGELIRRGFERGLRDLLPGRNNNGERRDPGDILRDLIRPRNNRRD